MDQDAQGTTVGPPDADGVMGALRDEVPPNLRFLDRRQAVNEGQTDADAPSDSPGEASGGEQHARIPDAILYCKAIPVGARLLYGALQRHQGSAGCFPSVRTLADELGVSTRSIDTWLGALIELGAVAVDVPGGGRRSTRYTLTGKVRSVVPSTTKVDRSVVNPAPQGGKICVAGGQPVLQSHSHVTRALEPESSLSNAREAEPPKVRQPKQPAIFPVEASPEVSAVLATLGIEPTTARIRAYAAVITDLPTANHQGAAAACAEWCERMERSPSPGAFRTFCTNQPAKGEHVNGAPRSGADAPGARFVPRARPSASPIRPSAATLERARAKDRGE